MFLLGNLKELIKLAKSHKRYIDQIPLIKKKNFFMP